MNPSAPPGLDLDQDIDYLGAAFWNQYNIISLTGFAALGLFVPGLWFIAGAAELVYLALVPSNARFQRMVRAELNREQLESVEHSELNMLSRLSQRDKRRYLELVQITEKIREVVGTVDESSRILIEQDIAKLDYLLRTFLRMLTALTRLKEHLAQVDRDKIQRDMKRLKREMEQAAPRIRAVKQRNVEILRQRLNRLDRADEDRELMSANIDTIEDTLKLIRDNVVSLNNPEGISDQIDLVVENMQENERLMESMSSFLDKQAAEDLKMPHQPAGVEEKRQPERERSH